jgi:hypothetical protein
MINPRELLKAVRAQPFHPFRLHMASGRTFDVRHPEMIQVGASTALVFSPSKIDPQIFEDYEILSLMLMESIEPLETSASP